MDPIITPAVFVIATRLAIPAISNSLKRANGELKQLSESFSKDIRKLKDSLQPSNKVLSIDDLISPIRKSQFQPLAGTFQTSSEQLKSEQTQSRLDILTELNTLKAERNISDQRYDEISQELELAFLNGHLTPEMASKLTEKAKQQTQSRLDVLTELNMLKAEHNISDQQYDEISQELELAFLNGHLTPEMASKLTEKAKL